VVEGGQSVELIDPSRLVAPVAMLDIADAVAADPDAVLSLGQVAAFESEHGRIPRGAAVFLRTGWGPVRATEVGALRFPGFGPDAARLLVEERGAVGLGIDTLSTDPGSSTDYPVHRTVSLPRGAWQLENLANLEQLPPLGAWVIVGVLKLVGGSGGPARVLALVPPGAG
jgi:kynurenine formamidase